MVVSAYGHTVESSRLIRICKCAEVKSFHCDYISSVVCLHSNRFIRFLVLHTHCSTYKQ